jgi:hypothetical protein
MLCENNLPIKKMAPWRRPVRTPRRSHSMGESVMNHSARNQGPWTHRLLVHGFTVALAVLCFWLSGFVLHDIATWPGPNYPELERAMIDAKLVAESERVAEQLAENGRSVDRETKRQHVLLDGTTGAQRTMSQLLDFQRLALEKGVTPSPQEQQALADSQRLFLDHQRRYQELNQQVAQLHEERDTLERQQRDVQARLAKAREPIQQEYARLAEQHRWRMAAFELGVMLPLLAVAVAAFQRLRGTLYAPLVHAFGLAVIVRTGMVMHEYFPARSFKYILIGTALLVVLRVLVYLVRMVAYPKRDWLVRQYREAYERFLCPVCEFPIRRGPLRYLFWTRRTAKKLPQLASASSDGNEPYTCPMCATKLYEECPSCHAQRHSLLPACEHCGATKNVEEIAGAGAPKS